MLIIPGKMVTLIEYQSKIKNSTKRLGGIVIILLGAALFYSVRLTLEVPYIHWMTVIIGISYVLMGFALVSVPAAVNKFVLWVFDDKKTVSAAGLAMAAAGLVLYLLI